MKPGAERDPFDEEPSSDEPSADAVVLGEPGRDGLDSPVTDGPEADDEPEYPYVMLRKTVKEGRTAVQFYLRDEFADAGERDLERRVEELLDTDVKKLDLREAAYAVAQRHPAEVAELLRDWGYDHR